VNFKTQKEKEEQCENGIESDVGLLEYSSGLDALASVPQTFSPCFCLRISSSSASFLTFLHASRSDG
jgi:hypothetical protein